jgi:hypothetical protein
MDATQKAALILEKTKEHQIAVRQYINILNSGNEADRNAAIARLRVTKKAVIDARFAN